MSVSVKGIEYVRVGTVPGETGARYVIERHGTDLGMIEFRDPLGGWRAYGPEVKPPHGIRARQSLPGTYLSRRQAVIALVAYA